MGCVPTKEKETRGRSGSSSTLTQQQAAKINELQGILEKIQTEYKAEIDRADNAEKQVNELKEIERKIEEAEEKIVKEKQLLIIENKKLEAGNTRLEGNVGELEKEVTSVTSEVDELKATREGLQVAVDDLEEKTAALENTKKSLEGVLKLSSADAEKLEELENKLFEAVEKLKINTKEKQDRQIREIFLRFDEDRKTHELDGVIEDGKVKAMKNYISAVKHIMKDKLEKLEFDTDGDGQVNFQEFLEVMEHDNFWADNVQDDDPKTPKGTLTI